MHNNTSNDGGLANALEDQELIENAGGNHHVSGTESKLGATGDTAMEKKTADAHGSTPSMGSAGKAHAEAPVEPDARVPRPHKSPTPPAIAPK